jgi:hypothetical protein
MNDSDTSIISKHFSIYAGNSPKKKLAPDTMYVLQSHQSKLPTQRGIKYYTS